MSHVVTIKCKVKDRKALQSAIERLGGKLVEGSTYKWFGKHVGDYPLPAGLSVEDMGKCHFKASFPNVRYEVGFIEIAKLPEDHLARKHYDKDEIVPIYDFYDWTLSQVMGGATANKFVQAYAAEKARAAAKAKGYKVQETQTTDGSIKMEVSIGY